MVPRETVLFRLVQRQYLDPAYFGRAMRYRFDAPSGAFGVCYLGTTLACCFLEVFHLQPAPGTRQPTLARTDLNNYYVAVAHLLRPLRLARLADDALVSLGIDQRVTAGDDYRLSQRWAAAIHAHPSDVDGVIYATRHHNQFYAVALFDRAAQAIEFTRLGMLGEPGDAALWSESNRVLQRFAIDLR